MKLRKRSRLSSLVFLPRLVRDFAVDFRSDLCRNVGVDVVENFRVRAVNDRVIAMSKLEPKGRDDMLSFVVGERVDKQLCLVEMLLELGTSNALLDSSNLLSVSENCQGAHDML